MNRRWVYGQSDDYIPDITDLSYPDVHGEVVTLCVDCGREICKGDEAYSSDKGPICARCMDKELEAIKDEWYREAGYDEW